MALVTHLNSVSRTALDFVLPPRCHGCGTRVLDDRRFCAACWGDLTLVSPPACSICDLPFDFDPDFAGVEATDQQSATVCAGCQARPPAFSWAATAMLYDDISKPYILKLKHGRATALSNPIGRLMAARLLSAGRLSGDKPWRVVPVPLHKNRYRTRRFNQSFLLAKALIKAMPNRGLILYPSLLQRVKATRSQGGLSRKGRQRNLVGAFDVPKAARPVIKGQSVLLVDDVFTTGATVESAARVMKRAGAGAIGVVCAARVVGPR